MEVVHRKTFHPQQILCFFTQQYFFTFFPSCLHLSSGFYYLSLPFSPYFGLQFTLVVSLKHYYAPVVLTFLFATPVS
jgi:hypothetical protein